MPSCSVIGCGVRKSQNQPFLTLHRLPSNEIKKRKWLDRIGVENIKTNVKTVFICSLHFDEKYIKKTLKVPRVQEDAIPSKFLARHAPYKNAAILTRNRFETTAILAERGVSNLIPANTATNNEQIFAPVPGTWGYATAAPLMRTTSTAPAPASGCRTSEIGTLSHPANTASTNKQVFAPVPGTWRFATAAIPANTATNNEQIFAPVPGTWGYATAAPLMRTTSTAPAPASGCRTSEIGTLSHPANTASTNKQVFAPVPGTWRFATAAHPSNTASTNEQVLAPIPGTWGFATAAPPVTTATTVVTPASGFGTPEISISADESIKIKKLEDKCESLKKKIKRLNEKVRRQKKKIAEFKNIISDLQERNLVNNENSIILEACAGPKDFLKRQILKSEGLPLEKQYSEETRKFALTLHFFSPKAYNFVRRTYNTCLPHPRTLTKWYQKINAEPGLCEEAFVALKNKVKASDEPIVCSLIFDEMSIRKSLCWDPQKKVYYGRVTVGTECDNDSLEVASQCLVFLLNNINGSWKLPIAYFFITSLTGEQKGELLKMCVQKCEEVGIHIVSVTCDGPAANFAMFQELGCQLTKPKTDTTFKCSESKLHVFLDPCHSIKLIRNTFGDLRVFEDIHGRKIDFKYIELLMNLQENEGLHMATKLTKAHLYFAKQKMKVRLATQLLSNSVADALQFCNAELKLKEFENCEGTVSFIKLINDVFDVLNSHSIRPPGLKKALCPENIGLVKALFEGAIGYLRSLRFPSGELVIDSRRKTGFIGLIIDMESAVSLYDLLVEKTKMLKYLPLYKISQDHVELFFSAIRARGGFNDNPNAVQFKAAFKRLLIRAEIRDEGLGNCLALEQINILNCSSTSPQQALNELTERSQLVEVPEDDSSLYEEYIDCLNSNLSQYTDAVITYIAGFVCRKLSRNIKCQICASLLFGDPKLYNKSLIHMKTRGGLKYPSHDVADILKKTEKIIKPNLNKSMPQNYYIYIFKFMMEHYSEMTNTIFQSDSEHDTNHKYLLIKSVIQTYLDIRFRYYGKKCTDKISLRNYLNKIILFRNE